MFKSLEEKQKFLINLAEDIHISRRTYSTFLMISLRFGAQVEVSDVLLVRVKCGEDGVWKEQLRGLMESFSKNLLELSEAVKSLDKEDIAHLYELFKEGGGR